MSIRGPTPDFRNSDTATGSTPFGRPFEVTLTAGGASGDFILATEIITPGEVEDQITSGGDAARFQTEGVSNVLGNIESTGENAIQSIQDQIPGDLQLAATLAGFTPLNQALNEVEGISDLNGFRIDQDPPTDIISVLDDVNVSFEDLRPPGGPLGDQVTITYSLRINFDPIVIPEEIRVGNQVFFEAGNVINQIPDLTIQFGRPQTGGVFGFGGLNAVFASVDIPPAAFIDTRTVQVECDTIISGEVSGDIARIESLAQRTQVRARQAQNELENIRDDILNTIGSGQLPDEPLVFRENISRGVIQDLRSRIQEVDVSNLTPGRESIGQLRDDAARLRNQIPTPCRDQVDISGAVDALSFAEEISNDAADLKSELQNILRIEGRPGIDCLEEYSDIDSNISNLREEFRDFNPRDFTSPSQVRNRIQELRNNREDIRSRIQNNVTETPCINEFTSQLDRFPTLSTEGVGLDCVSEFPAIAREISDLEAESFELSPQELRDTIDNISFTMQGRVDIQECQDQFESRLNQLDVGVTAPEQDVVNCDEEISQNLLNNINTFVSDAREFSRLREIERTQERFNEITGRGENVLEEIENDLNLSRCVNQFQSRVETALSRAEQAGPRRASVVPCGQRYSDIEDQVEQFENQVLGLTAPVTPDTIQQVSQQGSGLIQDIEENINPGRCREDFVSRVRGATGRLQGLQEQVRVTVVEERTQEAQESLNQLINLIQDVEVRRSGIGGDRGNRDNIL